VEAGRNPICEQSDVFFQRYSATNGGSGPKGGNNISDLFLTAACPSDLKDKGGKK
jgi:hypothetical protein